MPDDITDRYHYRYSIAGLTIFLLLITTKQYYGETIMCYTTDKTFGDISSFAVYNMHSQPLCGHFDTN